MLLIKISLLWFTILIVSPAIVVALFVLADIEGERLVARLRKKKQK